MDILTAGLLIARQRQASGLSQSRLALLCGIGRQALSEIERGTAPNARAATIFRIMDVIGLPVQRSRTQTNDWIDMVTRSAAVRYQDPPNREEVVSALTSGTVPEKFRPHLRQIVGETPVVALPSLVRQLSKETKTSAKAIWKSLDRLSADLQINRVGRAIST